MTAFTPCEFCGSPIGGMENAHLVHEDCDRFLGLECRCDTWACIRCCPDIECSPLQTACLLAREDVRARAEADEAAATGPASIERENTPYVPGVPTGFWLGFG